MLLNWSPRGRQGSNAKLELKGLGLLSPFEQREKIPTFSAPLMFLLDNKSSLKIKPSKTVRKKDIGKSGGKKKLFSAMYSVQDLLCWARIKMAILSHHGSLQFFRDVVLPFPLHLEFPGETGSVSGWHCLPIQQLHSGEAEEWGGAVTLLCELEGVLSLSHPVQKH